MAYEKTEKENLTAEIILKDIQHNLKMFQPVSKARNDNAVFYGSLLVIVITFILIKSPLAFLFLLIPIGYFAVKWFAEMKKRRTLTTEDFTVYTDKLTSVQEKFVDFGGKYGKYKKYILLCFEGGTEWEVPLENYIWSKTYRFSRKGIENTSIQGDTFYLLKLRTTGNTVVAYNTKFFEYKSI